MLSRHADPQLARSGCPSWGSLGTEGQFAAPALLSVVPACLCSSLHMFLVTLGGASVLPVLGLVAFGWNINSKHSPCPHTCSSRSAVLPGASLLCYTQGSFPLGPRKFPISFYAFLFHMCFSLLFASCCVVWREGQAEQSRLPLEAALSVDKHSGQTPQTSGFCSKFLSAHVKQLSKRETFSWKENI